MRAASDMARERGKATARRGRARGMCRAHRADGCGGSREPDARRARSRRRAPSEETRPKRTRPGLFVAGWHDENDDFRVLVSDRPPLEPNFFGARRPGDSKWRGAVGGCDSSVSRRDVARRPRADACAVIVPREPPFPRRLREPSVRALPRDGRVAPRRGAHPQPTELTGEAGSAKTQIALQLLRRAAPRLRGGLDGAAVYVHTEAAPRSPASARSSPSTRPCRETSPSTTTRSTTSTSSRPWTTPRSCGTPSRPSRTCSASRRGRERPVRLRRRFRLVAVSRDGRRGPKAPSNEPERRTRAALLRECAHKHDLAVVLTNHVVDAVTPDQGNGLGVRGGGDHGARRGPGPGLTIFSGRGSGDSSARRVTFDRADARWHPRSAFSGPTASALASFYRARADPRAGSGVARGSGRRDGGGRRRTARFVFPRISQSPRDGGTA